MSEVDEQSIDWDQVESTLVHLNSSNSTMTAKESLNEEILRLIYSKMEEVTAALTVGGVRQFVAEDVLFKLTYMVMKKSAKTQKDFVDGISLFRHLPSCKGGTETRAVLKFKKLSHWEISPENAAAVGGLFDALFEQLHFIQSECCHHETNEQAGQDVLDSLYQKILASPMPLRCRILAAMENSAVLPEDWSAALSKDVEPVAPSPVISSASASSSAMITQPAFPPVVDLEGNNLQLVVDYVRLMASASLPLNVASWHKNVKLYFNNMWGHANNKTLASEKEGWQSLKDPEILKALEVFLPENLKAKSETKLVIFKRNLQANKFVVDFTSHDLGSMKLQNYLTKMEISYFEIVKEEGLALEERRYLMKWLRESLAYNGLY
jgi:hypothetical protein